MKEKISAKSTHLKPFKGQNPSTQTDFSRQKTKNIFIPYRHHRLKHRNRPFATNYHMVHGGGQGHYYSCTGTSKQRQVKLHWFRSPCFNVPVQE